jgi:hypothetical protein
MTATPQPVKGPDEPPAAHHGAKPPKKQPVGWWGRHGRDFSFVYTTVVLAGLGVLAYWFLVSPPKGLLTSSTPYVRLALTGAFWAMLGGVATSYKAIANHSRPEEWKPEDGWVLWYVMRPFSSLVVGLVTFAILQVATTSTTTPSVVVLALVAFAFGTQERRFFALLYQAAGLIVSTPGDQQKAGLQITSISPAAGPTGSLLIIEGQGFQQGATVTIGGLEMTGAVVSTDGRSIAGAVPNDALGAGDVTVTNPDNSARRAPKQFTVTK